MNITFGNDEEINDIVFPFLFEDLPIKGKLIVLDKSWKEMIEEFSYNEASQKTLSQMTLAAVYFGSNLKFDGLISVQLQNFGNCTLAMVECTHDLKIRGLFKNTKNSQSFDELSETDLTRAMLALTVKTEKDNTSYQSIVPVISDDIEEVFRNYLIQSEQIRSELFLTNNDDIVLGLFIQLLPLGDNHVVEKIDSTWNDILSNLSSLSQNFNYPGTAETFLQNIFPEFNLRVFKKLNVIMECSCSRKKVEQMIILLGKEDSENIIREQGKISITCEMCKKIETFNKSDAEKLFE